MRQKSRWGVAAVALATMVSIVPAEAKTRVEVPVSSVTNRAYLIGMKDRPWWDKAYAHRTPILVSNLSDAKSTRADVDFVFDVGEPIDPASVRVVTPWETEVDCVAERTGQRSKVKGQTADENLLCQTSDLGPLTSPSAIRLIFQTQLLERENRPFLVYWNRQGEDALPTRSDAAENRGQGVPALAEKNLAHHCPPSTSTSSLSQSDSEVRVNNGVVEVVFDNLHRTDGLVKSIRLNGSLAPSELLMRATGYAWSGFEFTAGRDAGAWSKAIVAAENVYEEAVTFTNANATLDFSVYAGQPRVDYAYRLKSGVNSANVSVSWAAGGTVGFDDFVYPGLAGNLLTFRAGLDHCTDSQPQPIFYSFPWLKEGWYAIADRQTGDVVGAVFDRSSLWSMGYVGHGQADGQAVHLHFSHRPKKGECASGRGALVVTRGTVKDVRREYALLSTPPRVFVGESEARREIPVTVPVIDRDFCININVGGWRSSTPLAGDDWAENVISHIRALGANTLLLGQLTDFGRLKDLPVKKDLYDRISDYRVKIGRGKLPEWKAEEHTGAKLRKICEVAHRQGMPVMTWHDAIPDAVGYGNAYDEEQWALSREVQMLYPECGVDTVFSHLGSAEGTPLPKELKQKYGEAWWQWENPKLAFDALHRFAESMQRFHDYAHKVHPNTKVMVINSENSELGRDMFMSYYPGALDTLLCEFVAHDYIDKIKHTAKRLRAYYDNVPAKTVYHHYYCMELDHANRISQVEMPFICGVNGFSQESLTYENYDPELFEFSADFSRFAIQTKLGEKAAKMEPVKNLAVLRDTRCFEEDAIKRRTFPRGWWQASRHDARVNAFANIPSYNYDIVIDPFFKADSLSRYKVVYIPDDEVLSEALAKEALKFVEQGGGLVLEGASGEKVKKVKGEGEGEQRNRSSSEKGNPSAVHLGSSPSPLVPDTPTPYGKGKIVWTKEILTDALMKGKGKDFAVAAAKVKALVAAVGGVNPFEITKANGQECPFSDLDGVLQASDEGMFLGVFNRGKEENLGKVSLNSNNQTIKQSNNLFVLDVKNGTCAPLSPSNTFEIAVGPRQCGFYLIGGDAFTAVPKAKEAVWTGPAAVGAFAAGQAPQKNPNPDFRPKSCVEFLGVDESNFSRKLPRYRAAVDAGVVEKRFCPCEDRVLELAKQKEIDPFLEKNPDVKPFTKKAFERTLADAAYLHLSADPKECDVLFTECGEALKALLKRGGGILFNKNGTGPAARKFLAEVGVFDPYVSTKGEHEVGDGAVAWNESMPTNHPFVATSLPDSPKEVAKFLPQLKRDGSSYNRAFAGWDKAKQFAPYVLARDASYATVVIQDKVLGAGKIVFNENSRSFANWYEPKTFGDAVVSWFLGERAKAHSDKTRFYVGGVGEPVK